MAHVGGYDSTDEGVVEAQAAESRELREGGSRQLAAKFGAEDAQSLEPVKTSQLKR
jgi:hypothetical protein